MQVETDGSKQVSVYETINGQRSLIESFQTFAPVTESEGAKRAASYFDHLTEIVLEYKGAYEPVRNTYETSESDELVAELLG